MRKVSLLFLFLLIPLAQAQFADLDITVQEDGQLIIKGDTDIPELQQSPNQQFTFKKGPYWLLNITTDQLDQFKVTTTFPKNTEINYIKVSGAFKVEDQDTLQVTTQAENKPLSIVVQYRVKSNIESAINYLYPALVLTLLFVGAVVLFAKKKPRKKRQSNLEAIKKTLTENQLQIIQVLEEASEPITQKQVLHRTSLPKSTLSRNIAVLEKKNIIQKQSRGLVNMISIKKQEE